MWLDGLPPGDTDWDRFAASWPVPFGALADVVVAAWDETDPVLLELCRLRMATVLTYPAEQARRTGRAAVAGLDEAKLAALPSWPSGCYAFVQALSVVETFQRACLTLGIESVPDVDDLTRPSPDESQEVPR
jgi:hypothetical protein